MELILSVIFIIFGILQIILFFKLWGMTNDVKKIRLGVEKDLYYYILLGDKGKLENALEEFMLKEISMQYRTTGFINQQILNIPTKYMAKYKKYGIPFPEKYKELNNIQELEKLLYS